MTDKDKYPDGTNLNQFQRLQAISKYNRNYYLGFGRDLLYAESNDDNITEWFLVKNQEFYYLGESYEEDNNLHRFTKP